MLSALEDKIRIPARPCNTLYISLLLVVKNGLVKLIQLLRKPFFPKKIAVKVVIVGLSELEVGSGVSSWVVNLLFAALLRWRTWVESDSR